MAERHRQAGRIGAAVMHSLGKTNTGPARDAFFQRFLDEVDPNHELPEDVRHKRAEHARRAYFLRLAMKSAEVRRARKKSS